MRHNFAVVLFLSALSLLSACANSPIGRSIGDSLAADPRLQTEASGPTDSVTAGEATPSTATTAPTSTTASESGSGSAAQSVPEPGQPSFVGPTQSTASNSDTSASNTSTTATTATPSQQTAATNPAPYAKLEFTDLSQAPAQLSQPLQQVLAVGVLNPNPQPGQPPTGSQAFDPNESVNRRDYARWLVAMNNRLYSDRSSQQIRLATTNSAPLFQDVPSNDPDFSAIQGLAAAGIIPSSLDSTTPVTNFRPDQPLDRETMLLWKVPLDVRRALPAANLQAVQDTWGFQDSDRISPQASRAVLADYNNGDLANIRRVFGYTTLLQPKQAVTRAEAAVSLWYFGSQQQGLSVTMLSKPSTPSTASTANGSQ
ncbi:MAG: S-layer homology domain-containing protein [Cyanobacteria bacterium P01_H01_bin.121]